MRQFVEERFGMAMSRSGCLNYLQWLGFVPKGKAEGALRRVYATHETLHLITIAPLHRLLHDIRSNDAVLQMPSTPAYGSTGQGSEHVGNSPLFVPGAKSVIEHRNIPSCTASSSSADIRSARGTPKHAPRSPAAFTKSEPTVAGLFDGEPGFSGLKSSHSRRDPAGVSPSQKVAALLRRWKSMATGRSRRLVEDAQIPVLHRSDGPCFGVPLYVFWCPALRVLVSRLRVLVSRFTCFGVPF